VMSAPAKGGPVRQANDTIEQYLWRKKANIR
jgi:hypothetical protein